MNKKKISMTKLIIITVFVIIGLCLAVFSFDVPGGSDKYLGFIGAINTSTELDSSYRIEFTVDRNNGEVSNADINEGVEEMYDIFQNFMLSFNDTKITRATTKDGEEMLIAVVPGTELGSGFFTLFGEAKKLEVKKGDEVLLTNKDIKSASYTMNNGSYVVYVEFNTKGTRTLMQNDELLLSYYIGDTSVSGSFYNNSYLLLSGSEFSSNANTASSYAIELLAGKLPYTMTVSSNSEIDALAGQNVKTLMKIVAGIIALLYVVYMILRHKFAGLVTLLGGAIFVIADTFIIQSIPVTSLTLASYLAIILSFVVYALSCEYFIGKIENNYRASAGKRIDFSIKAGYKNSLLTLMDIHLVTLITALSMLMLGSKPIKAVCMMFITGIIISALINFVLNKYFIKLLADIYPTKAEKFNFTKGGDNK